ncbi:ABC transporter substrate-binding protein [Falsirhodobacter halotolerans]|uniref:ABC transporter substrate-binding protein n=1 Tax=Falsirhodobacter halotolerans TaxID=1146892 RepID=UPI001FD340FA|nr:ABC transporter substrate-binding protein [Falsirhodobacter halotolerans]MCJ8140267.1 ABC transporter substrate-binding protein [Falsirhodobacter halotolerans]
MNLRHLIWAALLALPAMGGMAQADALADIKARGVLVCGTLGTSEPFSFQDAATRSLVGYDVDICKLVADHLGVGIEYKLLAVAARIPELDSGRVDVLAANLGWTAERADQIEFSHRYYVTPQKLLVRADSDIQTIDDLQGKRIGATKGSSSERVIAERLPESRVIGYADSPATFLSLQQRKVDAQFASELVLVRLVNQSPDSSPTRILEQSVVDEPWGLGIRKGEDALLAEVNAALDEAETSGEAQALFDKWFGADTPYDLTRSFQIGPITN